MPKTYREVVRIMRRAGWVHVRTTGSHLIFRHPEKGPVTVAAGGKMGRLVPDKTLSNIRRRTGLDELR